MFNLSDDVRKIKTKLLVLSGVALFISLTEALPQKVAILGLDLSKNATMAGWFILVITAYYLISFLIFSLIEITKHYLPDIISKRTANTTGDTIGLTAEECLQPVEEPDFEKGSTSSELQEIKHKNQMISDRYQGCLSSFSSVMKFTFDFVVPIVFSFTSLGYLYVFLSSVNKAI